MFGIDFENFNYQLFFRTRKQLVFAIAAVVLSIITLIFVLIPQTQRVFSLFQELKSEKSSIVKLRQKVQALDAIETDPVYQNQNQITKVLPSRKAVFELLASLKFIADTSSITLRDIDLNPGLLATDSAQLSAPASVPGKQKIPGVEQILIKLRIEGSRTNINNFFSQINRIMPLTSVTEMKLQAAKGKTLDFNTSEFESEVELTTYYFNSSIVVSTDTPLPEVGEEEITVLAQLKNFISSQFIMPQDVTGGGIQDLFGEDALQLNN